MSERRRKRPREKDITPCYLGGELSDEQTETQQRFTHRAKHAQQRKIEQTAELRAADDLAQSQTQALPIGQVVQVYSLFCDTEADGQIHRCVTRKTLSKLSDTAIVVGDFVRFRDTGANDELGRPEAVIEQVLPRQTVLTRASSFRGNVQHPIVANADQMLIVVSLLQPMAKWGLVDRMLVAAQSGGLAPMVCLNKIDLGDQDERAAKQYAIADSALKHYQTLGIGGFRISANHSLGIDAVAQALSGKTTVLAGHSGVGKSTLISAIQPGLDIRVGIVSAVTEKGRHTTTSARRYPLKRGGYVIDTPGVKMFGLWNVTRESLIDFFPDIERGDAPAWREESYQRIAESL